MVAEGIHSENGFMGLEPKGQAHRKFTNKFSGGKIFFRAGLTGQTCHVGKQAFVPEIQIVSNRFFEKRPGPAVGAHGLSRPRRRGRRFRGAPGLGHPRRRGRRFRGAPGLGHPRRRFRGAPGHCHPCRRGRRFRPWPALPALWSDPPEIFTNKFSGGKIFFRAGLTRRLSHRGCLTPLLLAEFSSLSF